MQSVLRLIKNNRLRTFYRIICYLFTPVGRQAMHDNSIFLGEFEKFRIYLITFKCFLPLLCLLFLTHACPYICVQYIGILCGISWVFYNLYVCIGLLLSPFQNIFIRPISIWAGKYQVESKSYCGL